MQVGRIQLKSLSSWLASELTRQNLAEIVSPDFLGEGLMVCFSLLCVKQ